MLGNAVDDEAECVHVHDAFSVQLDVMVWWQGGAVHCRGRQVLPGCCRRLSRYQYNRHITAHSCTLWTDNAGLQQILQAIQSEEAPEEPTDK